MSQNPFIVGKPVPPERFVGRESEIAAAFDQIYSRSHLAIWGGPGMGKTSFLQKLESPQAWKDYGMDSSQGVIVRFSCESIVPFTSPNFWGEILNLLKEKLEGESTLEAEIDTILQSGEKTKDNLRQVLRKLGRQGKYLVLLIDDAMKNADSFLESFWQVMTDEEKLILSTVAEAEKIAIGLGITVPEDPLYLLRQNGINQTEQLSQAWERLKVKNYLYDEGRKVRVELIRRWLLKYHSIHEIREYQILKS